MDCPACALDDPSQINHMEYGGCLWEDVILPITVPKEEVEPVAKSRCETCDGCNFDPPNGHPSLRTHMGFGGCMSNFNWNE